MKLNRIVLTEQENRDRVVQEVIAKVLSMSVTSHYWHWQTKSYAEHKALGDFYEKMTEQADLLAEQFMGAGGEFQIAVNTEMMPYSKDKVVEELEDFKKSIVEVETELMKDENGPMHGVADTMIDVIKEVDTLLYLLTLE